MQAPGYFLTLPPTPVKPRFVLLEESTKTFYDIDTETSLLRNPSSWHSRGLSPSLLGGRELAIIIPRRLSDDSKARLAKQGQGKPWFKGVDFETGMLVVVTRREKDKVFADVKGRVNVCPFKESVMNWEKLEYMKGRVLMDELRNGLLGRVYAGGDVGHRFVHPTVLEGMPRKWHVDAAVMSAELDHIFVPGQIIREEEVRWILTEDDDSDDEGKSVTSGGSIVSP